MVCDRRLTTLHVIRTELLIGYEREGLFLWDVTKRKVRQTFVVKSAPDLVGEEVGRKREVGVWGGGLCSLFSRPAR
jgi:hypothetical protein